MQNSCEATLEPGPFSARKLCSAAFQSVCAALVASTLARQLQYFRSARETHSSVSRGKRKCTSRSQRVTDLCGQKFPFLVPDWSVLMQIRTPNPHSLTGPKDTVLTGQNRAVLVDWNCAVFGWGKPHSYFLK